MTYVRSSLLLALATVAASCGSSRPPDTTPPNNKPSSLEVTIAAVTLADDCGTGPAAPPVQDMSVSADEPQGSMMKGESMHSSMARRACEQSSIQLRVANGTDAASRVAIEKIEVVDESGAVVAELAPRDPSRWADDAYQSWDEQVAPSEVLSVSYALSAPYVERGATYTVRVTVAAGDGERTLEQKTTLEAEASLPPDAVT